MKEIKDYLARIGARGGRKSRRTLDPATARNMVRVRVARRAFRRYHPSCFPTLSSDRTIGFTDVVWVAEGLLRSGDPEAESVGRRLLGHADPSRLAEAIQDQVMIRMPAADRLEAALAMSESARALSLAGVRAAHPDWDAERAAAEWVRRIVRDVDGEGCPA